MIRNRKAKYELFHSIGVCALSVWLGVVAASATAAEGLTDTEISTAVESEYMHDDAVPFNRIYVTTEDGIVTLSGEVSTLAAKTQAERLASIVKGVRSIVNRIQVVPGNDTAQELEQSVLSALAADAATDRYELGVRTNSAGVVTLIGTTDSWAERSLAELVTMTVTGVTEIQNEIEVDTSSVYRDEGEIADDIRERMRWDVRVDDSLIEVLSLAGGRVLLSGTVGSLAEKMLAEQLAWVEGVTDVDATRLEVERWARDDDLRRGKYTDTTDAEIYSALLNAFRNDPRVVGATIDVSVDGGTVWLRGDIDNVEAKNAAERDAYNTVGVDRVLNHLRVRPEVLTDSAIEDLMESALRSRGLMDVYEIEVDVNDRHGRLTGDVDTLADFWQADRAASAVRGLEEVRNDLTVRGRAPQLTRQWYGLYPRSASPGLSAAEVQSKTDRELFADVRSELFWSPFVDEEEIILDVEDGVVTLSGTVDTMREADAAKDNAFEAGAIAVRNELETLGGDSG
jgi:osmotically-inducible protein OsmY